MTKNVLSGALTTIVTLVVMFGFAEGVLRLKNSSMKNYDIEMWRYSKELKQPDPELGHDHVRNASSLLQSVDIRTNEYGLRGGSIESEAPGRRILFLGASITLGWGVPEEQTVTALLEKSFREDGQEVEILNAGIGNYNAERYVRRFLRDMRTLHPTDIVVHYFLRDAEELEPGGGNWLLRNSQLAVTMWIAASRLLNRSGENSLVEHYQTVYEESRPGFRSMIEALTRLRDYAEANGIRVYLAMTPDVHNLKDYQFKFVHDRVRALADELGFDYVDLLPSFRGLNQEDIWAMPGDPHPNALGHKLMAESLYPVISRAE